MNALSTRLRTLAATTALALAVPLAASAATSSDPAAAYQGGTSHSGQAAGTAVPPLDQAWSVATGPSSFPVIAGGRVFVTAKTDPSAYGTTLEALDLATGTTLWTAALGGTYWWSAPAFDSGRVYALNYDGTLRAFDPASGAVLWTRALPGQYAFSSAPTAVDGKVFVSGAGSGGTVYAVDGASGSVLWTASVANGDDSSPAVVNGRVFVSYACQQAYAFDETSGALLWHHTSSCSGGGGKTVAVSGTSVYARDPSLGNVVLDAGTGAVTGTFTAGPIPAFDATLGYFVSGGVVTARTLSTGATAWTASVGATSAPLVVNGYVYVGTTGGITALSATGGQAVWSAALSGGVPAPDEQNVSQPLTGLGANGLYLVVPTSTGVVAFKQHGDFTVSAAASLTVARRGTATTPVTVGSSGGFSGAVSLTATGAAGGATVSISPSAVQAPGTATLKVVGGKTRTSFTVTVTGCANSICHSTSVAVKVS